MHACVCCLNVLHPQLPTEVQDVRTLTGPLAACRLVFGLGNWRRRKGISRTVLRARWHGVRTVEYRSFICSLPQQGSKLYSEYSVGSLLTLSVSLLTDLLPASLAPPALLVFASFEPQKQVAFYFSRRRTAWIFFPYISWGPKMVDLLERIDTLLQQESLYYGTKDYLNPDFQLQLQSSYDSDTNDDPSVQSSCFSSSTYSSSSSGINEIWREKICEWSYQVIDHFDFSREVVSVSIHFLDRYLSTRPVNKKLFQLAAMTTLYLAIKLYEPGTLSMESMIELSRGYFMVEQMAEMELSILR